MLDSMIPTEPTSHDPTITQPSDPSYEHDRTSSPQVPQSEWDGYPNFNPSGLFKEHSQGVAPGSAICSLIPPSSHSSYLEQEDFNEEKLKPIDKNELLQQYLDSYAPDDESSLLLGT